MFAVRRLPGIVVTYPIWLSQMELEHLVRSRSDRPGTWAWSPVHAYLQERANDASKLRMRQGSLDVHTGPSNERAWISPLPAIIFFIATISTRTRNVVAICLNSWVAQYESWGWRVCSAHDRSPSRPRTKMAGTSPAMDVGALHPEVLRQLQPLVLIVRARVEAVEWLVQSSWPGLSRPSKPRRWREGFRCCIRKTRGWPGQARP